MKFKPSGFLSKKIGPLFFLLPFFVTSTYSITQPTKPEDILESFLQPIHFSRIGILYFFENIFSQPGYAQDFLPYNFDHIIELIYMAHRTSDPQLYCKELTKLWREKYKEVLFTDARSVAHFLEELPRASKNAFNMAGVESRKAAIKKCIYDALLNKFNVLKQDPEKFLNNLSEEIIEISSQPDYLVDFLESILNKVLWSQSDKEKVFEIFERLDHLIFDLYNDKKILDEEGFYRLSNSLICRLKYHIEIAGGEMSEEFYTTALNSITDGRLHLLNVEEMEEGIISRAKFLEQILIKGQILARINLKGLRSDPLSF